MINSSSAIRFSNPASREVTCLNVPFNIALPRLGRRTISAQKLPGCWIVDLKRFFVHFLAKEMANFLW